MSLWADVVWDVVDDGLGSGIYTTLRSMITSMARRSHKQTQCRLRSLESSPDVHALHTWSARALHVRTH
jgi:hypothetical protein